MLTVALSQLLGRGVRVEPHEAVALARELLAQPCGIPTPENIQLTSDGSASCIGSEGVPSVASVAGLLLTLLPDGTPNVPAPLRYAIARGVGAVEAPPFASAGDFSSALERFERGPSREVLKGLLQRGARRARPIAAPITAPIAATRVPVTPPVSAPPSVTPRSADLPVHSTRRWAFVTAAALAASFAVGFGIGDSITGARAVTPLAASWRVSAPDSAAVAAAHGSAAKPAEVHVKDEIVRVPGPSAVDRGIVTPSTAARADASTEGRSASVEPVAEQIKAIQAIRMTTANAFSPAFASDGTAIFFHTGRERDARSAIEVASAGSQTDGHPSVMTIVDDGSHNYHARPSPDGRFVAFDSDRDGERGVYVANRDGSQVRRVSGPGYAALPTWSRNNTWLAYIRAEPNKPTVWNLWVQPAAGGRARRVTNYRYGQTWAASWFPDDRRIAYSHEDTLTVMDLRTGKATRYPSPVKGQLVRTPAVSPDGTKIIFQVFRHGAWLLDLASGSMQRVLTDRTAEEFAWSPDGRRVAFHSRRDGEWGIYVLTRG